MKLLLRDYESITIEADDIEYVISKEHVGLCIKKFGNDDNELHITTNYSVMKVV